MDTIVNILLVEDSPSDAKLMQRMLQLTEVNADVYLVPDGVEALRYLQNIGPYAGTPNPDLILLDLNLPRMNGFEVLDAVKSDPKLRAIPILVLTTSEADEDVVRSYEAYANSYINKPNDFSEMREVVETIDKFWFSTAQLPPRGQHYE